MSNENYDDMINSMRADGCDAWDDVQDVDAELREIRGETDHGPQKQPVSVGQPEGWRDDFAKKMREVILPCPFCGSLDLAVVPGMVSCENCTADGPMVDTPAQLCESDEDEHRSRWEAVHAWNRRHQPTTKGQR